MLGNEERKLVPAYVPYKTFRTFMTMCKEILPTRIDRSFWGGSMSGGTGGMLMASLSYLKLIDDENVPTAALKELVNAVDSDGETYRKALTNLLIDRYKPLFDLDLQRSTNAQFLEKFKAAFDASGSTVNKCVTFFVQAAKDAGIELSPLIAKGARGTNRLGTPRVRKRKSPSSSGKRDDKTLRDDDEAPDESIHYTGPDLSDLHPAVIGLLQGLTDTDSWTESEQKGFIDAFTSVLKFAYPAKPSSSVPHEEVTAQ